MTHEKIKQNKMQSHFHFIYCVFQVKTLIFVRSKSK